MNQSVHVSLRLNPSAKPHLAFFKWGICKTNLAIIILRFRLESPRMLTSVALEISWRQLPRNGFYLLIYFISCLNVVAWYTRVPFCYIIKRYMFTTAPSSLFNIHPHPHQHKNPLHIYIRVILYIQVSTQQHVLQENYLNHIC